jgi:predicted Rossmann-fold nucleotide-binding protein
MAAGIEGAGAERAFGVNILLPFEASATEHILGDPKLINFRYFFTRKLTFLRESHGFCLFPGGFGTMDEAFELLTLMQTGRTPLAPVVLLEPEGSTYWQSWQQFVNDELAGRGLVSPEDLTLARVCTTVAEARDELCGFYRTFHSQRSVGRRLVLRLRREVGDDELAALDEEFADIVESGHLERVGPTPSEVEDDDQVDLPRLAFRFDRAHFTRLRALIDRLNAGDGEVPPPTDGLPAEAI